MAEEGQLSFGISIDDSALKNEALNVEKAFADIAAKAKAAGVSMDESLSLKNGTDDAIKALNNLKATYNQLSADIKNSDAGKALKQSLAQGVVAADNFSEAVRKAGDQSNSNGIPETANRFNCLNASIQQVVRELPSASMGMNMFFLAISNNLPIVADQIKAINAANKEAAAQGQATSSVWSMIGKSLMGWQTLMMVGITLLTMYSGKIIEWVSSLFKGKDALAATRQAQVQFNEDMKKASDTYTQTLSSNAAQNISKYQSLSDSYKRLGSNISAQKKFIDANQEAFRELGLSIHNVRTANQALISDKAKMIDYFMTTARAAAYQATMVQLMQKQIGLKIKQYNAPNQMTLSEMAGYGIKATKEQGYGNRNLSMLNMMTRKVTLTPEQQKQYVAQRADWKADQIEAQKLNKQIQNLGNSAANTNMKLDKLKGSLSYVNSGGGESKSGNTRRSTPTAKDYASTINSRAKALAEAYKDLQDKSIEEEEKAQDAITAASLSGMKQGTQKEIAQIKQDAKNKQDEIDKSVRELATKLANTSMKEYLAKSPQNTYKGWLKTDQGQMNISDWENTITGNGDISGFTKQLQTAILKYRQSINQQIVANQTETNIKLNRAYQEDVDAMNKYLSEYGTYQEKRKAIQDLYKAKINNTTTEGDRKTLTAQMEKEISTIDIEANKKTAAISKLFDDMKDKAVADMEAIAGQGEKALAFLQSGQWDVKKGLEFGMTEETFNTLRRSPAELDKIREAINKVRESAEQAKAPFAQMADGLKKIFSANGNTSAINKGLEQIQSGFTKASSSVSFFTDALSSLGDSFGNSGMKKVANGLNDAVSAVGSTLKGAMTGAAIGGPVGAIAGAAVGLGTSIAKIFAGIRDAKKEANIQELQKQVDTLTKSYDTLGRAVNKAFSSDASNLINQQNKMLEQQKVLIQNQIKEEEDKKKTDQSRIDQWQQQIEQIDKTIQDNKDKAIDAIFGEDIKSAIEGFANAWTDAWAQGKNTTQSAKDYVKSMVKAMVTEAIKAASSDDIKKLRDTLQSFWSDEYISLDEQKVLDQMATDLDNKMQNKYSWAKDYFQDNEATSQNTTSKGFATASQDSIDELNGRFTAIQMNSETIKDSILSMQDDFKAIRVTVQANRSDFSEMRNLALLSVGHLEAISKNTHELYSMNEKLDKIERNTRAL